MTNEEYDVAISFASENTDVASELANEFIARGLHVFYSDQKQSELWGRNLYEYLSDVYRKKAKYCVVLFSEDYVRQDKVYTKLEMSNALKKHYESSNEYLLPIRLDDYDPQEVLPWVAYIDARKYSTKEIADLLLEKIKRTLILPLKEGNYYSAVEIEEKLLKNLMSLQKSFNNPVYRNKCGLSLLSFPKDESIRSNEKLSELTMKRGASIESFLENGGIYKAVLTALNLESNINKGYSEEVILIRLETLMTRIKENLTNNNLQIVFSPTLETMAVDIFDKACVNFLFKDSECRIGYSRAVFETNPSTVQNMIEVFDHEFDHYLNTSILEAKQNILEKIVEIKHQLR